LIVPAVDQAVSMQRDGDKQIGIRAALIEFRCEKEPESAAERPGADEFQRM
jgi:hypothetical protein